MFMLNGKEVVSVSVCAECNSVSINLWDDKKETSKWLLLPNSALSQLTKFISTETLGDDIFYDGWCCEHCVNGGKLESVSGYIIDNDPKTPLDSIAQMEPDGYKLKLPEGIFFSNYNDVKTILTKAGGKYLRNAFIFTTEAKEVKDRILSGETINDKKKFQFFATPKELADRVFEKLNYEKGMIVLEPSAGRGGLLEHIEIEDVECCELWDDNAEYLQSQGYNVVGGDFTQMEIDGLYDRVIANPPFTKNQDIDHIKLMYKALKDDGRMVSIASTHWQHASTKKCVEFREWLDSVGAEVEDVDAGAFKESGTNIKTCIITINK